MKHVLIIKDNFFMEHLKGLAYHPESPKRLESIYKTLFDLEAIVPLAYIQPQPASFGELSLIHDEDYIIELESIALFPAYLDPDTPMTQNSLIAAKLAAGALINAVDLAIDRKEHVFAFVRPPGHHAEKDRAMGFCLFNNVGIAARYAQKKYGIKKILICDWDVHHGNGTQHAFYNDPSVLYFSIHQYPHYPGTGRYQDIGLGSGEGFTINCPIPPRQGDAEYYTIFCEILLPIALSYEPELILVSAGFDAYFNDPLSGMGVTEEGFSLMTKILLKIASAYCKGGIILTLEGGYDLQGLSKCTSRVIEALSKEINNDKLPKPSGTLNIEITRYIERMKSFFSQYWQCLTKQNSTCQ